MGGGRTTATRRGASLWAILTWRIGLALRESVSHCAEIIIVALVGGIYYFGAYLPKAAWVQAILAAPLGRAFAAPCIALGSFALVIIQAPIKKGQRNMLAAGGLGLLEEYRLARALFALRNAWIPFLVFWAALPMALANEAAQASAILLATLCAASYAAAAPLAFAIRTDWGVGQRILPLSSLAAAFAASLASGFGFSRVAPSLGASSVAFLALFAALPWIFGLASADPKRRERLLASWAKHAAANEESRSLRWRWLGARTAILLEGLKKNPEWALLAGITVLVEIAAATDLVGSLPETAAFSADPAGRELARGGMAGRGLATLIICASLSSQAFLGYFANGERLFFRILPISYLGYAKERYLPALAAASAISLPLLLPLARVDPRSVPAMAAAILLVNLAAMLIGDARPRRVGVASITSFVAGIVLAVASTFGAGLALGAAFAVDCLLSRAARANYYAEELLE